MSKNSIRAITRTKSGPCDNRSTQVTKSIATKCLFACTLPKELLLRYKSDKSAPSQRQLSGFRTKSTKRASSFPNAVLSDLIHALWFPKVRNGFAQRISPVDVFAETRSSSLIGMGKSSVTIDRPQNQFRQTSQFRGMHYCISPRLLQG